MVLEITTYLHAHSPTRKAGRIFDIQPMKSLYPTCYWLEPVFAIASKSLPKLYVESFPDFGDRKDIHL
jgi:hypothetical protein